VRIAREIHRPISEVLEYPSTELNYWAIVFQEEYLEINPTKNQNRDIEIEKLNKIMK
jgi:hypothetical protein